MIGGVKIKTLPTFRISARSVDDMLYIQTPARPQCRRAIDQK